MSTSVDQPQSIPAAKRQWTVPDHVRRWLLLEKVSHGLYTQVFRARPRDEQQATRANYALKLIAPGQESKLGLSLLRREAHVAYQVSHCRVVPVLADQLDEPPYFLVSPWLSGCTLEQLITGGACLPVPTALWLARQAAEGLEALATKGWIHGDVKPANLQVGPTGHVTLLDLGFAQQISDSRPHAPSGISGTLRYLAPERMDANAPIQTQSDIYSLGVTIYEILTGQALFRDERPEEIVKAHREWIPPSLQAIDPTIPRSVAELVSGMLAKDPLRRPGSPRELIDRLLALEIENFCWG